MRCVSAGGVLLHLRAEALPGLAATDPAHRGLLADTQVRLIARCVSRECCVVLNVIKSLNVSLFWSCRIHNVLKGIPDDRDGLFDTIQRSKNHYQKRAYQCIKCMVALFSNCSVAYQILQVRLQMTQIFWNSLFHFTPQAVYMYVYANQHVLLVRTE